MSNRQICQCKVTNKVPMFNQGTIVDRIDYNIQSVSVSIEEGLKQLQKVLSSHSHSHKMFLLIPINMTVILLCCQIMWLWLDNFLMPRSKFRRSCYLFPGTTLRGCSSSLLICFLFNKFPLILCNSENFGVSGREKPEARRDGEVCNSTSYYVLHHASPVGTQGDNNVTQFIMKPKSAPEISSLRLLILTLLWSNFCCFVL